MTIDKGMYDYKDIMALTGLREWKARQLIRIINHYGKGTVCKGRCLKSDYESYCINSTFEPKEEKPQLTERQLELVSKIVAKAVAEAVVELGVQL